MTYFLEVSSACVAKPSGIYRYVRQLSRAMIQQAGVGCFEYVVRSSKVRKKQYLPYWMQPRIRTYEGCFRPFGQNHLLHGMDMKLPWAPGVPSVVSAMDVAPFRLQQHQLSSSRFLKKKKKDYQKAFRRADLILSISQATARDLSDLFDVDEKKIRIVHLGVQPEFRPTCSSEVLARYGLSAIDGNYLLYVGTLSVRKNLPRLLEAYAASRVNKDYHLVLSGEESYGAQEVFDQIVRLGLQTKVHWIGYAASADLPVLYSHAAGFTFPTMYEGFGLPILEAMACGTPVLAGNLGASPEIAGGYALLVDPFCVEAIATGLEGLVESNWHDRQNAIDYAQSYSWSNTAKKTLSAYQEAILLHS